MASISFHNEDIVFNLSSKQELKNWIGKVIAFHVKKPGPIHYIFCSDHFLLGMNQTYLFHDEYTDVITFDYSEGDLISGDIFISIDRVRENALENQIDFLIELNRVMIHGVLHLLGMKDKTPDEARLMREAEDTALKMR